MFGSRLATPRIVLITIGKNEIRNASSMRDSMPAPNHRISSGASASLGTTWRTTITG